VLPATPMLTVLRSRTSSEPTATRIEVPHESGREQVLAQFLDDETIRPGLETYTRESAGALH
jgi:hypothetical protein